MALKSYIMWSYSFFSALSFNTSFFGHHSPVKPLCCPLSKHIYAFRQLTWPSSIFSIIILSISLDPNLKVFSLINQSISVFQQHSFFLPLSPLSRLKGLLLKSINRSVSHLFFSCPLFSFETFMFPSQLLHYALRHSLVLYISSPPLGCQEQGFKKTALDPKCSVRVFWFDYNKNYILIVIKIIFWLYLIIQFDYIIKYRRI